jgi:probable HAF family extracellular repeat protein
MNKIAFQFYAFLLLFTFPYSLAFSAFFKGLGTLPGDLSSNALSVSADGNAVVGESQSDTDSFEAFRWTAQQGMVELGFISGFSKSSAKGVSQDGEVVIGITERPSQLVQQAFRWTESKGMTGLGFLGSFSNSEANAISSNGAVIVGYVHQGLDSEAFRWTVSGGMSGLGHSPMSNRSIALSVSSDGSVVVGYSGVHGRAFKWTEFTGMQALPLVVDSGFQISRATDVSDDGSIVVGSIAPEIGREIAVRWDTTNGVTTFLGHLEGGNLVSEAVGVSGDGSVVVGFGSTAKGFEAFIYDEANGIRNLKEVLTNQPYSCKKK